MSSAESFSTRVIRSLLYSGLGTTLGKIINLGAIFVVLKLISPEAFGIASIVLAIFAIIRAITEMGLGVAIVQAEKLKRRELDSLFWLSLALNIPIYGLVFVGAPLAAIFYSEPLLSPLIKVNGIIILISTLYHIPRNMLKRDLHFREIAIIDNASMLFSSVVMLVSAYMGMGAWAIILGGVSNRVGQLVLAQFYHPFWPKLQFNFAEVKERVEFGLYATGSRLLYNLYSNADYLIVGRVFGAEAVGIYTLAFQVINETVNTLTNNINEVAYPAFARLQAETERLRKYFFTLARGSLLLFSLALIIIAVYIDKLLLLGGYDKWMGAVPLIHIFAAVAILKTISPLIPQLLNAVGEARLNFFYSLSNAIIMPIAFLIGAQYSLMGVGWAWMFGYPVVVVLLFYFASKKLNLSTAVFTYRIFSGIWLLVFFFALALGLKYAGSATFGPDSFLVPLSGILIALGIGLGSVYWKEKSTIDLLRGKKEKPYEI